MTSRPETSSRDQVGGGGATLAPACDYPVVFVGTERMQNRRMSDSMVVTGADTGFWKGMGGGGGVLGGGGVHVAPFEDHGQTPLPLFKLKD